MMIWKFLAAALVCGTICIAQTPPAEKPQPEPKGKVLFSSDNQAAPAQATQEATPVKDADDGVSNAERSALTYTAYNLDVHLTPQEHTLSVHARVELKNISSAALKALPIQLSSALNFEEISLNGRRLKFAPYTINSDTDHTGQLHEAVVPLDQPLAPQSSVTLNILYSGTIEASAKRLEEIGTPADLAAQSDWDEISHDFVGLRGFGNVVWYPVTSVPALLGDGAKVFAEIAAQKARQADTSFGLHLTVEFSGQAPDIAAFNGHLLNIDKPAAQPGDGYPGILTCDYGPAKLGFAMPTLVVAVRTLHEGSGVRVWSRPETDSTTQGYMTSATLVQPLLQQWFADRQKAPLTIIDLPDANDASFQQNGVLLTSLAGDAPEQLAPLMIRALAHVYFQSPREWLSEGVTNFAGSLWVEHVRDRNTALESLESTRGALALVEPATPGSGPGEDLIHATSAAYTHTKSTYVLWMLRDMAGDKELAAAFHAYDPAADTAPEYFEQLVDKSSGKDFKWFFNDWVYRDRGLPDLSIAGVYPSPASTTGQYLVAVDLQNDGYAEAEVPVTVKSNKGTLTERVRLPAKTRTTHRMLVSGIPEAVDVNDGAVPEVQDTVHERTLGAAGSAQ